MAQRLCLGSGGYGFAGNSARAVICDPLTGWYNRRYMQEALERDIHRASRARRPVSLVMFDIDHFKNSMTPMGMRPVT